MGKGSRVERELPYRKGVYKSSMETYLSLTKNKTGKHMEYEKRGANFFIFLIFLSFLFNQRTMLFP